MKALALTLSSIFALIVLILLYCASAYISNKNMANRFEQSIIAAYKNDETVLSKKVTSVQESAQVPGMQRDDVVATIKAAITGRYGANGSQAVFQAIKEQNPSVSPELYIQLQRIIESGSDDFNRAQQDLIDKKRAYGDQLGSTVTGFWMHAAGYPKINLAEYDIVIETSTAHTFETKRQDAIQLRPTAPAPTGTQPNAPGGF